MVAWFLIKESVNANANNLFAKYRASKEKAQKTVEASIKALKAVSEMAMQQLPEVEKHTKHTTCLVKGKPAWFEKFHCFNTSDNYLVLGM